jgi:Xaa-Pro aminopeptidase
MNLSFSQTQILLPLMQIRYDMKYEQIDKQLFIANRAKLAAAMEPKSLAIFNSNDIYPTSADGALPFSTAIFFT